MNKKEIKLISVLLEEAAEIFDNHGCNDIPDEWLKDWTEKEKEDLLSEIKKYGIFDDEAEFGNIGDDTLMYFYHKKLLNETNNV